MLRAFLQEPRVTECRSLRHVFCGGEELKAEDREAFYQRLDARLHNLYGPTEVAIDATYWECEREASGTVPIGRPLGNVQVYILDAQLCPVPVGTPGELHVGGVGLARGYLNRPELTAEKFIPDPFGARPGRRLYQTGDLARYRADGRVEYLGRMDQQVKVRGFRIELGEVEAAVSAHAGVQQALVTVQEFPSGEQRLVAYVVGEQLSGSDLRAYLQERLPEYMVPGSFVLLGELPLLPNGKIDRRALAALNAAGLNPATEYVAPRTAVEEELCAIWAELLGVARVGVNDSFFELGGHSLLATRAISRIRTAFGAEIAMRAIFEHPTVSELAAVVESGRRERKLVPAMIERGNRDTHLPLSFSQQRLWFIEQLGHGKAAYSLLTPVRLTGNLDVASLARALTEIVRRHEVLRTTFALVDSQPVQVIGEPFELDLTPIDLSHVASSERERVAFELLRTEAARPFDLSAGPLLRTRLVKLTQREHVLVLVMHHIVGDGWSTGVLVREMNALYAAYSLGEPSPLGELPIQYGDYAVWQRQRLSGELLAEELAYWRRQLAGAPQVLELPTDRARPAVQSFRGESESFTLDEELSSELKELSHAEGVTLFMTLLAGFQSLLSRYSGQTDVVVGTDVANRQHGQTECLIGFFINQLVLRTSLSGDPTFREILRRVKEVCLGAYAHQELPFEKVVEELQPERSLSHSPLFQVKLVLQNVPQTKAVINELTLELMDLDTDTVKYDIALFLLVTERKIIGFWKYRTDLFDAGTIKQMIRQYQTLLHNAANQPDVYLSKLELLTETERNQLGAEKKQRKEQKLKQFMKVVPRAMAIKGTGLIKTSYATANEKLPLVIEPAVPDVDLIGWARGNREFIESELRQHGAILFRGFSTHSASVFEQLARAACRELYSDYGDLPRERVSSKIYGSTPYPNDKPILFHNESSHQNRWPMRIWFYCAQAASEGGETPIVDCRRVYQRLDPVVRELFERKGLKYVRNYTDGLDVSWQEFFHTTDRSAVEEQCRRAAVEYVWRGENRLRTSQVCQAVATHPATGESVFFNQVQLHHVSCLDSEVRDSLLSLFNKDELPRNVYFGDGSPIEDQAVDHVSEVYRASAVNFPWREGDILMVDNMLVAHARNPYVGPRKIMVAMGDLVNSFEIHTAK
jgi:non-ribosomal peptide synthetase component F/alpha-ketoglutarate-dependent taurine dioxygenase